VSAGSSIVRDSHEPSYYEIALTNRQVLVAFVVLLVSVLGAFVGGVWLGRGGRSGGEPAPVVVEKRAAQEPESADELTFYSERQAERRAPAERASTGKRPAVPSRRPPSKAQPPRGRTAAPAETSPATTLAQDIGAERAPTTVAPPPSAPPPSAPPPSAPPPSARTTSPRASGPGFVIQVFSGRDEAQAREILKRLKADGRKAFLAPVAVGSLTMYRVRVGIFADRAAADRVASEITHKLKLDTWITAVDG